MHLDTITRRTSNIETAMVPLACQLTALCACRGTDRQRTPNSPGSFSSACPHCRHGRLPSVCPSPVCSSGPAPYICSLVCLSLVQGFSTPVSTVLQLVSAAQLNPEAQNCSEVALGSVTISSAALLSSPGSPRQPAQLPPPPPLLSPL